MFGFLTLVYLKHLDILQGLDAPVETPEEIAQMLDDGVKRSRKQVQVYDPYAEFAEIEQRKQDKIDKKNREEKEEKERLRQEKKKKKRDEKERKQRERDELRESLFGKKTVAKKIVDDDEEESPPKKQHKEPKPKKAKKQVSDKRRRQRRERRERNENPEMEKIKQAWDSQHRNRALAAFLRFGFARFCKVRNESNLTSVPIHDFEHFFRSCKLPRVVNAVSFLGKETNCLIRFLSVITPSRCDIFAEAPRRKQGFHG